MKPHHPLHPGEIIKEVYMAHHGWSCRACAQQIGIAPSTLGRILSGAQGVTPRTAQRLSQTLGSSAESWLNMQATYDDWKVSAPGSAATSK